MAGKLITLPLRVSLRSARLLTRAASGVAGCPLVIPGRAIHIASFGRPDHLVRWLGEAHATEAELEADLAAYIPLTHKPANTELTLPPDAGGPAGVRARPGALARRVRSDT